jgi:hypothetical protein
VFSSTAKEDFSEALKNSWLSIQIHDPMMKGRSGISKNMESTRNSMNPRTKEKHEEEHEDSKKERKARTTSHYINNHKITKPDMKAIKQKN